MDQPHLCWFGLTSKYTKHTLLICLWPLKLWRLLSILSFFLQKQQPCFFSTFQNLKYVKWTLSHAFLGLEAWAVCRVWQHGWVFVYELSGCGLESSCSDLNFRHRACLEQGFASHAGNYRVLIHSEKRTCHDKNIQRWSSCFFSKCAEFDEDWKYTIEISETTFGFWVNGVWTCCGNFSQSCREYMWSAANVLVKSPKSSYVNKTDVFSPNLSQSNQKLRWKCCRADFSNIWDPWTRWVSKGVLKQEPSGIQVTTFLEGNNFRNF